MSLIKSIRKQLGLSVTPANNFTLDAGADDGTMKLARGNAGATTQDILTVDATGKVKLTNNLREWSSVTITPATPYVAPDWDIVLNVVATTSANNVVGTISLVIGAATMVVAKAGGGTVAQCTMAGTITIPANSTYSLTHTNVTAVVYMELS